MWQWIQRASIALQFAKSAISLWSWSGWSVVALAVATSIGYMQTAPWPIVALVSFLILFLFLSWVACVVVYSRLPPNAGIYSPRILRWHRHRLPFRSVCWHFDNYLSGPPPDLISQFSPSFEINYGDGIVVKEAYIECKRTGAKADVLIERGNPYMKVDNTFYPKGKRYHCQAFFWGADNNGKKREGLSPDEFLSKYDGFRFVFAYDDTAFNRDFSREELVSLIEWRRRISYTRPEPRPSGAIF
jgi:hypothetical protein